METGGLSTAGQQKAVKRGIFNQKGGKEELLHQMYACKLKID